ncbi:MAG: alpha/beta fold hydrolase [Deltaproteobacteria bacterium]|nr:alpha/beta fold hydrolase [Deltaproteobacteria bacterium]
MLQDRDLLKIKSLLDKLRYEIRRFHHHTWGYLQLNLLGNNVNRKEIFDHGSHPVLLLHGWVATRRVMSLLERRLRRDGYSVFSVHLGGLFDTFNSDGIPRLAEVVAGKVEKIRQRHDLGRISIIGHSEGGLIARYYVKRLRGNRNVRTLITLGTPHRGTIMAFAGIFILGFLSRSIWQLTPLSPFIREMKKGPWPKDVKLVTIFSRADWMSPYPSCILEEKPGEPVKNIEVENVSHAELLFSRAVYNAVKKELPPPKEPAEAWRERTISSPALQETLNID